MLMQMLKARLRAWARHEEGNITLMLGLVSVPLIAVAGLAVDMGRITEAQSSIQQVADGAALAAASAKGSDATRISVARAFIKQNLPRLPGVKVTPDVAVAGKTVTVTMNTIVDGTLLAVAFPARNTADAVVVPGSGVALPSVAFAVKAGAAQDTGKSGTRCLIALNTAMADAIYIRGTGKFTATDCEVHANSSSASAIHLQGNADAQATRFTAVGGWQQTGGAGTFSVTPEGNQSAVADPYSLTVSDPGGTAATASIKKQDGTVTLSATKYSSITVQAQGVAVFSPGIHYITGTLSLGSQATVTGNGVTLVLLGSNARIDMNSGATLKIQAPTSGTYEGFALVGDKSATTVQTNTVQGGAGSYFRGIVYTPKHKVYVTGNGDFNVSSSYSPMIVDNIEIGGNGTFSIGVKYSDYGCSKPTQLDYSNNGKARLLN